MAEALTDGSKQMGWSINWERTKYVVLSRENNWHNNFIVRNVKFEWLENFKFRGGILNVSGNSHQETFIRINSVISYNKRSFEFKTIFKSKLVSIRSKLVLYKLTIHPMWAWNSRLSLCYLSQCFYRVYFDKYF